MHIDGLTKEEIDEGSSVSLDGALPDDVEVPEPTSTEGSLLDQDGGEGERGGESPQDEYEYVPLSDVTEGWVASIKDFVVEHFVPIALVVVFAVCMLIMNVGSHANSVLIAIGFVMIMLIFGIMLYFAWKDRQQAKERYEYARKVQQMVRDKVLEEGNEKDD